MFSHSDHLPLPSHQKSKFRFILNRETDVATTSCLTQYWFSPEELVFALFEIGNVKFFQIFSCSCLLLR